MKVSTASGSTYICGKVGEAVTRYSDHHVERTSGLPPVDDAYCTLREIPVVGEPLRLWNHDLNCERITTPVTNVRCG